MFSIQNTKNRACDGHCLREYRTAPPCKWDGGTPQHNVPMILESEPPKNKKEGIILTRAVVVAIAGMILPAICLDRCMSASGILYTRARRLDAAVTNSMCSSRSLSNSTTSNLSSHCKCCYRNVTVRVIHVTVRFHRKFSIGAMVKRFGSRNEKVSVRGNRFRFESSGTCRFAHEPLYFAYWLVKGFRLWAGTAVTHFGKHPLHTKSLSSLYKQLLGRNRAIVLLLHVPIQGTCEPTATIFQPVFWENSGAICTHDARHDHSTRKPPCILANMKIFLKSRCHDVMSLNHMYMYLYIMYIAEPSLRQTPLYCIYCKL